MVSEDGSDETSDSGISTDPIELQTENDHTDEKLNIKNTAISYLIIGAIVVSVLVISFTTLSPLSLISTEGGIEGSDGGLEEIMEEIGDADFDGTIDGNDYGYLEITAIISPSVYIVELNSAQQTTGQAEYGLFIDIGSISTDVGSVSQSSRGIENPTVDHIHPETFDRVGGNSDERAKKILRIHEDSKSIVKGNRTEIGNINYPMQRNGKISNTTLKYSINNESNERIYTNSFTNYTITNEFDNINHLEEEGGGIHDPLPQENVTDILSGQNESEIEYVESIPNDTPIIVGSLADQHQDEYEIGIQTVENDVNSSTEHTTKITIQTQRNENMNLSPVEILLISGAAIGVEGTEPIEEEAIEEKIGLWSINQSTNP